MDRFLKEVAKMACFAEGRMVLYPHSSAIKAALLAFGLTSTLTSSLAAQVPYSGPQPGGGYAPNSIYAGTPPTMAPVQGIAPAAPMSVAPTGYVAGTPMPPQAYPHTATPAGMPVHGMPVHGMPAQGRQPTAAPQAWPPQAAPAKTAGATPQMTTHGVAVQRTPAVARQIPMQRAPMHRHPQAFGMRRPQPPAPPASLEMARDLERQGNVAGADAQFRAVLSQTPNDRQALISYARMKHRVGQLPESIQIYQRALQLYPNDPVILNDLGLCFARLGDFPNAVSTLRASVGLRPDSQRYRNNLAIVLLEMDRAEEAHAVLAEVHGEVLARYNVSVMLHRRGKTQEAREMLSAIVAAHPQFGPARTMLGQLGPAAPAGQPVERVASLPASPTSQRALPNTSDSSTTPLNLIEPQSAELAVGQSATAAPAVFHADAPPEVDAYPIPGVGLEEGQ